MYARPNARLVSYPRSGRTWLGFMLDHIAKRLGLPGKHMVMTKHDGAMIQRPDCLKKYVKSKKKLYTGRKVILLVRDPRDVLCSLYFMLTVRHAKRPEGKRFSRYSIEEFIKSKYGLQFIVTFMNGWAEQRKIPDSFFLLRYEDLRENTFRKLLGCLWFLDITVPNDIVRDSIYQYSFQRMQNEDKRKLIKGFRLSEDEEKNPNALSVRSGTIGGYADLLSDDVCQWVDRYLCENLHDLYWFYKPG